MKKGWEPPPTASNPPKPTGPFTPYQRKLFVFLSVATFFEGYDFMALSQILPQLGTEFSLDEGDKGNLVAFINAGTMMAYLLVQKADRWGRTRVLSITIAGYTVCTFLSGFATNIWLFAIAQHIARIFLIGEWVTSMVIAAEEFPAARRGTVIGVIQAFGSLGSIVCAGTVSTLLNSPWGWRTIYFMGIIPLIILAYSRRNLRESKRFSEQTTQKETKLFDIFRTPYRKRMLQLAAIWFLTYVCTTNAVTFWKQFVVDDRGFTDADVSLAVPVAAVVSMPLIFFAGKLLDVIGRKRGALVIFGLGALGVFLSYSLEGQWPLTVALIFGIFGVSAVLPVLNTYNTELFPTELRSSAFAWSNNIIGRSSYVIAPLAIGHIAELTGGFGSVMQISAIFPLLALALIWMLLPETQNKELEETAGV